MKRRKLLILGAFALVLVLGTCIGTAWAYFTTYSEAQGGFPLRMSRHREITVDERFSQWTKRISLQSSEDSVPVVVRARVFAPTMLEVTYRDESGKWSLGEDGFYYYSDVLHGGESTEVLFARIGDVPIAPEDGDSFDVVLVYESTFVHYMPDGTPYADWSVRKEVEREDGWKN